MDTNTSAVNIESLTFDLTDCELIHGDETTRLWFNPDGVRHLLTFSMRPVSWNFDLTKPRRAIAHYGNQCKGYGGAMLSLGVTTVARSEALCGLFKYRAEQNKYAMLYVGIIWIPFDRYNFQLNVEAMEQGTTGTREAWLSALGIVMPKEWKGAPDVRPVMHLPSDDEEHDKNFPTHPLSQVRTRLSKIIATAKFDDGLQLKSHRMRSAWTFWRPRSPRRAIR